MTSAAKLSEIWIRARACVPVGASGLAFFPVELQGSEVSQILASHLTDSPCCKVELLWLTFAFKGTEVLFQSRSALHFKVSEFGSTVRLN